MSRYRFEPESRLEGFTEDGTTAITAAPGYFEFWDRWKTIALVVASAALIYQLSKSK